MIRWRIDETPCGKGVLTFADDRVGVRVALMFPDMDALQRVADDIADGAECATCDASFEGMSAFVEAFPEMF